MVVAENAIGVDIGEMVGDALRVRKRGMAALLFKVLAATTPASSRWQAYKSMVQCGREDQIGHACPWEPSIARPEKESWS